MALPKIFMSYRDVPPAIFFESVLAKYLFFLGASAVLLIGFFFAKTKELI